ncbi:MAG: dephospho-CoA kinase [Acholeplasma sp.]|nr:MAG: dephospho-CoA kinase [Acholeplasma sp.]
MEPVSVQSVNAKPIIIGLTGGIASGKSTASTIFKAHQIPVIDNDQIVHDLWEHHREMVKKVEDHFGFQISGDGRKKLAKIIFNDETKRLELNAIVHPYVFGKIEEEKKRLANEPIIVIDMPLLFEVGYEDQCDEVCLVYVEPKIQLQRLMFRDQLNEVDATKRINSQWSIEKKKALADVIFDNQLSIQDLEEQIDSYIRGLNNEE